MKIKTCFLLLAFAALACLFSCRKDRTLVPAPVDCTGVIDSVNTFTKNIYPNITGIYCAYAPCHGGGTAQFGVDMSTYGSTVTAFQSQNALCAIKGDGCILMPLNMRPLDSLQILQIECWQANGYPN
jgi:hypothetical protein